MKVKLLGLSLEAVLRVRAAVLAFLAHRGRRHRGGGLLACADPLDLDVEVAHDALRPHLQVGDGGEESGGRAVPEKEEERRM